MKIKISPYSFLIFSLILIFTSCAVNNEVQIGLLGSFKDQYLKDSIDNRNGAQLAIEEINQRKDNKGKKWKLITFNDYYQSNVAKEIIYQIKRENEIEALIGPVANQIAVNIIPQLNELNFPIYLTACTTPEILNRNDNIFTLNSSIHQLAEKTWEIFLENYQPGDKLVIFYQVDERYHSYHFLNSFYKLADQESFSEITQIHFYSYFLPSFKELISDIQNTQPQHFLIIANTINTAYLVQQISRYFQNYQLYGCEWAVNQDLLIYAGDSLQNMHIAGTKSIALEQQNDFYENFKKRYGKEPTIGAFLSYQAVSLHYELSKKRKMSHNLILKALFDDQLFTLGDPELKINQNGDVNQEIYHYIFKKGSFIRKEE
ncbi:MAG: ABC transporter substrate-binding protein [Spirochaetes bacterium]|nr:ABC transporter substrate-binding protein [Spirochaetota bacterium]